MPYFYYTHFEVGNDLNGKPVYQSYTLHAIAKHLLDDVILHGSLSQHSMFSSEGALGIFKKSIKGKRGVGTQFIKGCKNFNFFLIQINLFI